jgi:hypothetical protein
MKFRTRTGSVYELDEVNKLVRRLVDSGVGSTIRLDEEWRAYVDAIVVVGKSALIEWPDAVAPLIAGVDADLKCTITSEVTAILPDEVAA